MLEQILKLVAGHNAPDVHLKTSQAPILRMPNGNLLVAEGQALTSEDVYDIARKITSDEKYADFEKNKQVDCAYSLQGVGRFRVNVYQEQSGPAIAFRLIPAEVPAYANLGLPEALSDLAMRPRGLLLVTGPTGSGKSTTLASLIDLINQNKRSHIITIEDPIEYVYESKKSLVTQREIGIHSNSFPDAIKASLRQDPDVIMVGEMRDLETIAAAITLAETGHLVLATLHTQDAAQSVDRMIDVFPAYQQQQIRAQLSVSLLAVLSQVLVPKKEGGGRIAAAELMISNDAVKNCIKEGETHQIYSMIQIGREEGMQTLDTSLAALVKAGLVTPEAAISKARDVEQFLSLIR
ncbi:type IV pili twitching motility protein PilT [Candidatus Peregrinibacteria bacterium CG22_combo_CG10-13_8_21_14_all_44_10]|nr:MAG: type IV pili twitching motility protein PilT [Candidatus Peregrinibacteria bacterium CG2_30_44_17]PIP66516.1 MAG: type IV pili twitching motility protein PilT [Candidatus Peregrinibacteria bacterium CG22_combo_CG10-13_8_21_14_all_44_10]PIS03850.1 MAG: type IV pili twitching motility protein PilT [Candidatus Peregrinibacteria bacterium CG10_big_fil_rev_8_21_14_0_10_44_7]PIX80072.1 MAG: type IV pili twitching motility protein PilT [Candidatus Peregrinibacteria bacterium CG_4_10_14_3_um_fil